jgi:hypothetical protein
MLPGAAPDPALALTIPRHPEPGHETVFARGQPQSSQVPAAE